MLRSRPIRSLCSPLFECRRFGLAEDGGCYAALRGFGFVLRCASSAGPARSELGTGPVCSIAIAAAVAASCCP